MFALHWSKLWFGFLEIHPWFVPSNKPVKRIFSFICIRQETLQGQTHAIHSFSLLQFSEHPPRLRCMMLHASEVATLSVVILLSARINSSIRCSTVVSVAISTGDLVGHHMRLSNVIERISRPSCEPLYATNTSHRKQETFLYEYPPHWVFLPTKSTTQRCSSVVHPSSTVAILTTEASMRACYLNCHEAGLYCSIVIHIENLLRPLQLFTSICDLFTDSSSYEHGDDANISDFSRQV
jgi:hypothetical protein